MSLIPRARDAHRSRITIAALLAGLYAAGSALVHVQLAHASLCAIGYTGRAADTYRAWWIEAYDYGCGLLWARRLVRQVAPADFADEVRVTRLAVWVFDHFIGYPSSMPNQEDQFLNTARRGYGYCDQLAHILATLYWSAGYPSRLFMLRSAEGISNHTVTQVQVRGRWILVDPSYKILFRDPQGRFMTVEDLGTYPEVLSAYGSHGAYSLTQEDFWRGRVFRTLPYTSIGNGLMKIAQRLQRFQAPSRSRPGPAPAVPHARGSMASAALERGIRRLDRARWHELLNEDALAQSLYLDLVQDPYVPPRVKAIARYWLARTLWRMGYAEACAAHLSSLRGSPIEEPWQSAADRLWNRCHTRLSDRLVQQGSDGINRAAAMSQAGST